MGKKPHAKKFHINAFEVHFLELDVAGQLRTRNPPDQTKTLCPLGCSIFRHGYKIQGCFYVRFPVQNMAQYSILSQEKIILYQQ